MLRVWLLLSSLLLARLLISLDPYFLLNPLSRSIRLLGRLFLSWSVTGGSSFFSFSFFFDSFFPFFHFVKFDVAGLWRQISRWLRSWWSRERFMRLCCPIWKLLMLFNHVYYFLFFNHAPILNCICMWMRVKKWSSFKWSISFFLSLFYFEYFFVVGERENELSHAQSRPLWTSISLPLFLFYSLLITG